MSEIKMEYYCSFCGEHQADVRKLISNKEASAFICNQCIGRCIDTLITPDVTAMRTAEDKP